MEHIQIVQLVYTVGVNILYNGLIAVVPNQQILQMFPDILCQQRCGDVFPMLIILLYKRRRLSSIGLFLMRVSFLKGRFKGRERALQVVREEAAIVMDAIPHCQMRGPLLRNLPCKHDTYIFNID